MFRFILIYLLYGKWPLETEDLKKPFKVAPDYHNQENHNHLFKRLYPDDVIDFLVFPIFLQNVYNFF